MSVWSYSDKKPSKGDKICFVLKDRSIDYGTYFDGDVSTPDRLIPWNEVLMWKIEVENYLSEDGEYA
jgi:hypothetical protein